MTQVTMRELTRPITSSEMRIPRQFRCVGVAATSSWGDRWVWVRSLSTGLVKRHCKTTCIYEWERQVQSISMVMSSGDIEWPASVCVICGYLHRSLLLPGLHEICWIRHWARSTSSENHESQQQMHNILQQSLSLRPTWARGPHFELSKKDRFGLTLGKTTPVCLDFAALMTSTETLFTVPISKQTKRNKCEQRSVPTQPTNCVVYHILTALNIHDLLRK